MSTASSDLKSEAHVSGDPTVVNHCVFCGSGAISGRSDGGIECDLCQRAFTVMEQPLYSNMPSTDEPAGVEATPFDPLSQTEPFNDSSTAVAPPAQDPATPPEEEVAIPGAAEVPVEAEEEEPADGKPPFLSSRSGVGLDDDDFVLHHALREGRA